MRPQVASTPVTTSTKEAEESTNFDLELGNRLPKLPSDNTAAASNLLEPPSDSMAQAPTQPSEQLPGQSKLSSQSAENIWLSNSEMLPAYFPDSRILGFGFDLATNDAQIDFEGTAVGLLNTLYKDRGEGCVNPIIFVGHGFGAVVIETLLSEKFAQDPTRKELVTAQQAIASSTASVVLFAPPIDDSSGIIQWTEKSLPNGNESRFIGIKGTSKLSDTWNGFKTTVTQLETMANISVYESIEKKSNEVLSSPQGSYTRRASSPSPSVFFWSKLQKQRQ